MYTKILNFYILLFSFAMLGKTEHAAAQAPDTLQLSLPEAEKLFVQHNYQLIA